MRGVTRASAYASTMELFSLLVSVMFTMCSSQSHFLVVVLNIQVNKKEIIPSPLQSEQNDSFNSTMCTKLQ